MRWLASNQPERPPRQFPRPRGARGIAVPLDCADCRCPANCSRPVEEKVEGKGRTKRRRDMTFLPAQAAPGGLKNLRCRLATEDFWQVELAQWCVAITRFCQHSSAMPRYVS